MKKLQFETTISASKEKVWQVLWDDATYRAWTSTFHEGSHAVSDWKEGSEVLFLGPNGDGMFSIIAKNIPNRVMSFKHLGMVENGKKRESDDETRQWSGAMENYTLEEQDGVTVLKVDVDITEEHEDYFQKTFPKALEKVKELAEQSPGK